MKAKFKTIEIKIFKSEKEKYDWAYFVKDITNDKLYAKSKKYLKKIFGKKPFDTIYKVDVKISKNDKGYKDINIMKVHGTYAKI